MNTEFLYEFSNYVFASDGLPLKGNSARARQLLKDTHFMKTTAVHVEPEKEHQPEE